MEPETDHRARATLTLARATGRLSRWNEERGFGFVTSTESAAEFFVHLSAFPRDGQRPHIGEALSFAIETTAAGRKQAVDVRRLAARSERPSATRPRGHRTTHSRLPLALGVLATGLVIGAVWFRAGRPPSSAVEFPDTAIDGAARVATPAVVPAPRTNAVHVTAEQPVRALRPEPAAAVWQCGGRQHCSQMSSCEEATWVLQNCPDTKMDGDGDGIPCETQWCPYPQ